MFKQQKSSKDGRFKRRSQLTNKNSGATPTTNNPFQLREAVEDSTSQNRVPSQLISSNSQSDLAKKGQQEHQERPVFEVHQKPLAANEQSEVQKSNQMAYQNKQSCRGCSEDLQYQDVKTVSHEQIKFFKQSVNSDNSNYGGGNQNVLGELQINLQAPNRGGGDGTTLHRQSNKNKSSGFGSTITSFFPTQLTSAKEGSLVSNHVNPALSQAKQTLKEQKSELSLNAILANQNSIIFKPESAQRLGDESNDTPPPVDVYTVQSSDKGSSKGGSMDANGPIKSSAIVNKKMREIVLNQKYERLNNRMPKSKDPSPKTSLLGFNKLGMGYSRGGAQHQSSSGRESRNQQAQTYLSHQVVRSSDPSAAVGEPVDLTYQSVRTSQLQQRPDQVSQPQLSYKGIKGNKEAENIVNHKQVASKAKGQQKQQVLKGNKTPQDVFQYKAKPPHLGAGGGGAKGSNQIVRSNQLSLSNNTSLANTAQNQNKSGINSQKPGNIAPTSIFSLMRKSDSQESFFRSSTTKNGIENLKIESAPSGYNSHRQQPLPQAFTQLEASLSPVLNEPRLSVSTKQLQPKRQSLNNKLVFDMSNQAVLTQQQQQLELEVEGQNNQTTTSVRVIARFRPLNKIEKELKEGIFNQQKINKEQSDDNDLVKFFNDQKTIKIKDEFYSNSNNLTFTFDNVLTPQVTQEEVFEVVGQQTITDVMNGYNGTIFAYGQTGSGKTHTMYGSDILDDLNMGIIPRSAKAIFKHIKSQDLEIEYQIRVQMIEIYKENLRDLLNENQHPIESGSGYHHHLQQQQIQELKIKEDPKRGTYVEGLTEACIVSYEEMMAVICTGETMRSIASTKLNQYSSRSHSICIIEIQQKYPNDLEKRSVLNLVDLAGSERVSKSHAKGQALEEAKKINFSLSMLGKVINSLTKNAPYIPYRDSKLTRLLKESLGGNNKTTLLVACSPHSSNMEETISTLRFAQSAKFIQNRVTMNIKTSPEQLKQVIQQLKNELQYAHAEIIQLRTICVSSTAVPPQNEAVIEESQVEETVFQPTITNNNMNDGDYSNQLSTPPFKDSDQTTNSVMKKLLRSQILHNRPHDSLLAKNYDVIETNNQKLSQLMPQFSQDFSIIPGGTPSIATPQKSYELKLSQLIRRNEDLEMRLKSRDKDLEACHQKEEEMIAKVNKLEEKIMKYKQKVVVMEKSVAGYELEKDIVRVGQLKQNVHIDDQQHTIDSLKTQVNYLKAALMESETHCQTLLTDKQRLQKKTFLDFINQSIKVAKIDISEGLQTFLKSINDSYIGEENIQSLSDGEPDNYSQDLDQVFKKAQYMLSIGQQDYIKQGVKGMEASGTSMQQLAGDSSYSDVGTNILKFFIVDLALSNQKLQKLFSMNKWRQQLQQSQFKAQADLCQSQSETIGQMEQILEKTRISQDTIKNRIEKLECYRYDNRNYYGDIIHLTEDNNCGDGLTMRQNQSIDDKKGRNSRSTNNIIGANGTRNVSKLEPQPEKNLGGGAISGVPNGSLVSYLQNANSSYSLIQMMGGGAAVQSYNHQGSRKQRFMRTITNKTLGKGFNFNERSPLSRASGGAHNMSILSQYYGQQQLQQQYVHHNTNATPMRTDALNSPSFCDKYQSPESEKSVEIPHHNTQAPNHNISDNFAIIQQQQRKSSNNAIVKNIDLPYPGLARNLSSTLQQQQMKSTTEGGALNKQVQNFGEAYGNYVSDQNIGVSGQLKAGNLNTKCVLNQSDIEKIDSIESLQELKQFIKQQMKKTIEPMSVNKSSNINNPNCNDDTSSLQINIQALPVMPQKQHTTILGSILPPPMYAQYQSALQIHADINGNQKHQLQSKNKFQESDPLQSSNQYAVISNDCYQDHNVVRQGEFNYAEHSLPGQSSSSQNLQENLRQEHVMTLASDYMFTSNSVIGGVGAAFQNMGSSNINHTNSKQGGVMDVGAVAPNTNAKGVKEVAGRGVAGQYNHQFTQNEYLDRLQDRIVLLQEEVESQKYRAEEHRKAYLESKKHIEQINKLMNDMERQTIKKILAEVVQWEETIKLLRDAYEKEILVEQKEIGNLHDLLNQWINSYQQIQASSQSDNHKQRVNKLQYGEGAYSILTMDSTSNGKTLSQRDNYLKKLLQRSLDIQRNKTTTKSGGDTIKIKQNLDHLEMVDSFSRMQQLMTVGESYINSTSTRHDWQLKKTNTLDGELNLKISVKNSMLGMNYDTNSTIQNTISNSHNNNYGTYKHEKANIAGAMSKNIKGDTSPVAAQEESYYESDAPVNNQQHFQTENDLIFDEGQSQLVIKDSNGDGNENSGNSSGSSSQVMELQLLPPSCESLLSNQVVSQRTSVLLPPPLRVTNSDFKQTHVDGTNYLKSSQFSNYKFN